MSQTIADALSAAKAVISDPIDAEVILAEVLSVSRSYLFAYKERCLTAAEQAQFATWVADLANGVPVAYIIGHREFWSLDILVTPDTLIPRPETELLVEAVLHIPTDNPVMTVADLGTGSGAIACAIAHERPLWNIYATDKSHAALKVAERNAKRLVKTPIHFAMGDWCDALPAILFDMIVSNPPYIAADDAHIQPNVLRYEPRSALIAGNHGLHDIQQIILGARAYLRPGGYILIEHGFAQGEQVRNLLTESHYFAVKTHKDLAGLERVTEGRVRII